MDEKETNRELYDEVCRVLTWWEHPEEYPAGDGDATREMVAEEMYIVLVKVQNHLCEVYDF